MARPHFDRELAAKVLALAAKAGDAKAAKHFGISVRSVKRYRAKMLADTELAQVVTLKVSEFEAHSKGWAEEAAAFMSQAIKKLGQLVAEAKPEQMRDVVGAIKIVGELDITRTVMGSDEQPGTDSEDPKAQAPQVIVTSGEAAGAEEGDLH